MFQENVMQMPATQFVKNTEWFNPTDLAVTIELHTKMPLNVRKPTSHEPLTHEERTGNVKVVIPPKGTIHIPAVYDRAIQYVRDGVIQSGLAPQLIKKGVKEIARIHPALDTAEAERKMAEATIATAVKAQAETQLKYQAALDELNHLRNKEVEAIKPVSEDNASESTGRSFVPPPPKANK